MHLFAVPLLKEELGGEIECSVAGMRGSRAALIALLMMTKALVHVGEGVGTQSPCPLLLLIASPLSFEELPLLLGNS